MHTRVQWLLHKMHTRVQWLLHKMHTRVQWLLHKMHTRVQWLFYCTKCTLLCIPTKCTPWCRYLQKHTMVQILEKNHSGANLCTKCTLECKDVCTKCTLWCWDICTKCTLHCRHFCTKCTLCCRDVCTKCTLWYRHLHQMHTIVQTFAPNAYYGADFCTKCTLWCRDCCTKCTLWCTFLLSVSQTSPRPHPMESDTSLSICCFLADILIIGNRVNGNYWNSFDQSFSVTITQVFY